MSQYLNEVKIKFYPKNTMLKFALLKCNENYLCFIAGDNFFIQYFSTTTENFLDYETDVRKLNLLKKLEQVHQL